MESGGSSSGAKPVIEFANFRLDPQQRKLCTLNGTPLALNSRAFDTLLVLVERRGEVVSKHQLLDAVWPRAVVEENNLSQAISALRKTLGDSDTNRIILTVPGRGFCFVAEIRKVTDRNSGKGPDNLAPEIISSLVNPASAIDKSESASADLPEMETPQRSQPIPDSANRMRSFPGLLLKRRAVVAFGVFIMVVAALAAWIRTPAPASMPRLAILMFENQSPDPANAFFAAGLHDEILNQLGKIRNLKVISRQSVLRYVDSELTIPEIARELRVSNIMEGTVRFAGDRIRVTVQLIDTATDEHLWSETFEMDFKNVFEAESQIAMNVAKAMEVSFSAEERVALEKIPTQSSQAYALYLEALSLNNDISFGDAEAGDRAQQLLDQAITLDAGFASAYLEKANILALFQQIPQAREYASKALALDSTVGRADLLEVRLLNSELRFAEAVPLIDEFLEEHPNDVDALHLGVVAHHSGNDFSGALALAQRAYEIEQTATTSKDMSMCYSRLGRHQEALSYNQQQVQLEPQNATVQLEMAYTLAALGRVEDAVAWITKVKDELLGKYEEKNAGGNVYSGLIYANALAGRDVEARRLFARFKQEAEAGSDLATRTRAYISAGDLDQGLLLLQQMSADKSINIRNSIHSIHLLKFNPHHLPALDGPEFVIARENL